MENSTCIFVTYYELGVHCQDAFKSTYSYKTKINYFICIFSVFFFIIGDILITGEN